MSKSNQLISPYNPDPEVLSSAFESDVKQIGIALVRQGDCVLIRQRPLGSPMPGVWEFPGGKSEPNELPQHTAVRECLEESGLSVIAKQLIHQVIHTYPHGKVHLHYFFCDLDPPNQIPDPHTGFRWVEASQLHLYRFPEANEPVIQLLM